MEIQSNVLKKGAQKAQQVRKDNNLKKINKLPD